MDPIKQYGLDKVGVVVDTDPIESPVGAFSKAQNAVPDPIGEQGALRKRPGLVPLNAVAASGQVLGGIGVPITLGSAGPNFSNPFTDTPSTAITTLTIPTFTISGLPKGPTFDDNSFRYPWDPNFDFHELDPFISDIPAINRFDPDNVTLDFFTVAAGGGDDTTSSTAGSTILPINIIGNTNVTSTFVFTNETMTNNTSYPSSFLSTLLVYPSLGFRDSTGFAFKFNNGSITVSLNGIPAVNLNNKIYYAAAVGGVPFLRSYDGYVDRQVCGVQLNTGVAAIQINSLLAANNKIYFSAQTSGVTSSDTAVGRVYEYDPLTNNARQLGAAFATDQVPFSMTWAYGRIWVGTMSDASSAQVFWMRPDASLAESWVSDNTFAAGENGVASLATFQGQIYAAITNRTLAGSARLMVRASSNGAWTASDTGTIDTNAGHLSARGYVGLQTWPSEDSNITSPAPALFAHRIGCTEDTWPNLGVRRLSGGIWTTVLTHTAAGGSGEFVGGYAVNTSNTIIPILSTAGNGSGCFNTHDGTTWTDRSAQLAITATGAMPTLFAQV